jgi:hypothetical protein
MARACRPCTLLLRWAKGLAGPGATDPDTKFDDLERYQFYTNTIAQQYYKTYVTQIVSRYK